MAAFESEFFAQKINQMRARLNVALMKAAVDVHFDGVEICHGLSLGFSGSTL
jgi:hypothetical protein